MADRMSMTMAVQQLSKVVLELLNAGETPGAIEAHLRALQQDGIKGRIKQLPADIKAEVDRLIRDGSTIDRIVAHLRTMGADVSRSAVGRYKKTFEEKLARYREAQEVAAVWVAKLGENPAGDVGRLIAEMLKTVAFQTLSDMGDEDAAADPKDIMMLARAISDLEKAGKVNLDRELQIRAEAEKRARAEAAKALDKAAAEAEAAGERGLSAERLAQLRRDFLGVRPAA